ncbi:hypothetical protein [Dongia deserti]|uniref:hypothetical protein n=1 Tax=Dongia deserti TaxID=2268030 RepID=UPI0013C52277|nr:hypothetical protein [Dongia deserti]
MPTDPNPQQADSTFRFRVHSGEILDHEGNPTGMTLQELSAAAEASFVQRFAADPEQQKITATSESPPHPALVKLVRLLARQAVRELYAGGAVEKSDPHLP